MRASDQVSIGWSDPGQVVGEFARSLMDVVRERSRRIAGIYAAHGPLLTMQRNQIVATFLDESHAQWLLMVDTDVVLAVEAFDKLTAVAHAKERPVVGGLYFGLTSGPVPGQPPAGPAPLIYQDPEAPIPVWDYPEDTLINVNATGAGCLLIHRSVLAQIRAHATKAEGRDWCWFLDLPVDGYWFGEDFYFCARVQAEGFPIVVHTGVVLPHRRQFWLDDRTQAGLPGGRPRAT